MSNPVGWSSTTPPQYMTNRDPNVSEVARRALMSPQQSLGAMMMRKPSGLLNADLPEAEAKAQTAVDYGMAVAGATNPIRAFHGSPHTFNRFDMSKLGTGEGAQAYGHGLYFAGNEGVARAYRDVLAPAQAVIGGRSFAGKAVGGTPEWYATKYLEKHGGDVQKAAQDLLAKAASNKSINDPFKNVGIMESAAKILPDIVGQGAVMKSPGSMYEVNLRTSPERLLDWDKPLAGQSAKVNSGINEILHWQRPARESLDAFRMVEEPSGRHAYSALEQMIKPQPGGTLYTGNPKGSQFAAAELKDAGIDGIQYLDGGSRAAGEGFRNYVMFDDKLIDILRRYGILGTVGGGAASGLLSQEPAQ